MAIEEQRSRVRRSLEEKLGVEEASYLMDRPPGGWSELVTNRTLDASIATLRHELRADIAAMEARLAWKLVSAVIAGMAVMGALFAGITSIAGG